MAYYGGTPVSYAVAFSLQAALRTMLLCSKEYKAMHGVIDLNDPTKAACKLTGLLPLHVAVANSLTNMFNFLVDLPGFSIEYDDMRAVPTRRLQPHGTPWDPTAWLLHRVRRHARSTTHCLSLPLIATATTTHCISRSSPRAGSGRKRSLSTAIGRRSR